MLIVWLWFANLVFLHPFHVSVCDVVYETADNHFKISVRMFLDDLENTLKVYTDSEKFDITNQKDSAFIHQSIQKYLDNNLHFTIDGKSYSPVYLGGEIDIDVMWCYLEVEELPGFRYVSIKNSIMTESFIDQENIVHIRKNGEVKSLRLNNDRKTGTLNWK